MHECVVKQFSKEQTADVDKSNIFAFYKIKPAIEISRFSFQAENKEGFIAEIKRNLPADITWSSDPEFEKKVAYLYDGLYDDYSQVWFKSLASSGSDHAYGAEKCLTIILRDVLKAKCESAPKEGREILDVFLTDKYRFPIFKRYVLLSIDLYWSH